jgi:hypothetical protein
VKAARDRLANWHRTPGIIAAIAPRCQITTVSVRGRETGKGRKSLSGSRPAQDVSSGFGTNYESHIAAWSALLATLSIIVDVPLEREEDAEALLATLTYTGWRHVPCHQQSYVALRMARFVSTRIMGLPFGPTAGRGL